MKTLPLEAFIKHPLLLQYWDFDAFNHDTFNLREMNPTLHRDALDAIIEKDVAGLFCFLSSTTYIEFLADNFSVLWKNGMWEEALYFVITGEKYGLGRLPLRHLIAMLNVCNRRLLRGCGEKLPSTPPFVVYRGVSGSRRGRRVRGLSWTSSLDVACWFAMQSSTYMGGEPQVYTGTLLKRDIYFYTNEREENEFVGRPKTCRRMGLTRDDIAARADYDNNRTGGHAGACQQPS